MTENKHAPFPWFDWAEYREQHGRSVVAYRDASGAIVSVLNCEEQEANARLIVTVPDLLAALQLVKEDIEGFLSGEWDGSSDGWRCTLAGINAVLANIEADPPAPAASEPASRKTNELMTGLLCECGHDYACHAPAPHYHCGECNCKRSRVRIADRGGALIAELLASAPAQPTPAPADPPAPVCRDCGQPAAFYGKASRELHSPRVYLCNEHYRASRNCY